ncbi:MAG TPA: ribonuclease Z [Firmicutes bacterium]|nr:ribonuclease Z [Bacillota bacterium]
MIDFVLLGCGGGMPMPNRYLSAMIISYRGKKILIDCGEGTQVSMRLAHTGFKHIDVICITHIHGDHIIGLPGLLSTIGNSGRLDPITIIGPSGIKEAVAGLCVVAKYLPYEVCVVENPKEELILFDEVQLSTLEVDHTSPCLAYRLAFKRAPKFDVEKAMEQKVPKHLWGKLQKSKVDFEFEGKTYKPEMVMGQSRRGIFISVVTDTRPNDEIATFIKGSDLLICEGTYGANEDLEKAIQNKHMTFAEAANLAKLGNVSQLLLTHYSTSMPDPSEYLIHATKNFENTVLGYDRLELNLKFKNES